MYPEILHESENELRKDNSDVILLTSNKHITNIVMCFSYPLIFDDFADVNGGLGVLSEVPLLLEKEALSALPT